MDPRPVDALALVALIVLAASALATCREGFSRPEEPRVCVLMYSTPNVIPQYAGLAARINEAYARRHGYAFRHVVEANATGLVPAWARVPLIRRALDEFDAVFYIDGDAVFNDHSRSLAEFSRMPYDLVGCSDSPQGKDEINGGALLFKSSPWSKRFVDAWWDLRRVERFATKFTYEQAAMSHLIRTDALGARARTKVLPATAFNSSYPEIARGRRDTFVLHFMSMDAATRKAELSKVAARLGV